MAPPPRVLRCGQRGFNAANTYQSNDLLGPLEVKLWTIQNRNFVNRESEAILVADWNCASPSWRLAYRWMADQWSRRFDRELNTAPVWCWHSCNGVLGSPPTVGTAEMLMGDWDYYASKMFMVELEVPDNLVLLSSYWRWNEALDDALYASDIIRTEAFADMFDDPLIKHETDDIQAIIPHIHRSWIIDVRSLPEQDRDWERFL